MVQEEALDILKLGHNVFLTGPAGSGKTHTLNTYIAYLKKHGVEVAVTASTGIAATHMGGVTIHSWAGIGIKNELSEWDMEGMLEKEYLYKRFQKTKVLIIDEVSMLHDYRLDMVERVCRLFRRSEEPFGGLQVILSGDFFQLPPISRPGEPEANFIHRSDAWRAADFRVCYLEEQYRQRSGEAMLEVLRAMRENTIDDDIMNHLRRRYRKMPKLLDESGAPRELDIVPTKLYTHNVDVDRINTGELEKLETGTHVYEMRHKGRKNLVESLKKSALAPEKLVLKKGAQVMFVKNNFDDGYVNGTLGTVVDFDKMDAPVVETVQSMNGKRGKRITVSEADWSIEEDGKTKASLTQLPLRLAWAITVHKSQGMSLDAIEVDLSKSFVPGMGYVALSRVRTLGGLSLLGLNDVAMQVDPEVLALDAALQGRSLEAQEELHHLDDEEKQAGIKAYIREISPSDREKREKEIEAKKKLEKQIPTEDKTQKFITQKYLLADIAKERNVKVQTILNHLEKLLEKEADIDIDYLRPHDDRFREIADAFDESGGTKLAPVKKLLPSDYTFEEIQIARLFL